MKLFEGGLIMPKLQMMDAFGDIASANASLQLKGTESSNELLDYVVLKICRGIASKKAFKGGWMPTKLIQMKSRVTKDTDLSISCEEAYEEVKVVLKEIAEEFMQAGIIDTYRIKETITATTSGGIDLYKNKRKILGADIGLHEIRWGVQRYDLSIASLDGFEIERMLADKIIAILSSKRFRRTKDLYDFYIIVWSFDFDLRKLCSYIDRRGGAEWDNIPFSDVVLEQYQQAWERLDLVGSQTGKALFKNEFSEVLETFYEIVLPLKAKSFVCPYWRHAEGELCDD